MKTKHKRKNVDSKGRINWTEEFPPVSKRQFYLDIKRWRGKQEMVKKQETREEKQE